MLKRCKNFLFALCGFFSIIWSLDSCKHDPASLSNLPSVCFDPQIKNLIGAKCGECHSGGSSEERGFDATDYNSIMKSVKAGNPWGSKLYTIISSPNNPNMMPPKGREPFDEKERTLIEVWILQGANKECGSNVFNMGIHKTTTIDIINLAQFAPYDSSYNYVNRLFNGL